MCRLANLLYPAKPPPFRRPSNSKSSRAAVLTCTIVAVAAAIANLPGPLSAVATVHVDLVVPASKLANNVNSPISLPNGEFNNFCSNELLANNTAIHTEEESMPHTKNSKNVTTGVTVKAGKYAATIPLGEITEDYLEDLNDELKKAQAEVVHVDVHGFDEWPIGDQTILYQICCIVANCSCKLSLKVDGVGGKDPVEVMIERLVGYDDLELHGRRLESAIYAAHVWCGETGRPAAAARIAQQMWRLDVPVSWPSILKQIRVGPVQANGDEDGHPTGLATRFIQSLSRRSDEDPIEELRRTAEERNSGYRRLHFYAGGYYQWNGRCWRLVAAEELQATVACYLQQSKTAPKKITQKLITDIIANVKGQSLVACGDQPLPFWVEDYGPPSVIQRRQLVVLQNGMLDIDAVIAGKEPELQPQSSKWFSTVALPFAFDPAATCPQFEAFLQQMLKERPKKRNQKRKFHDRRIKVLQEFFGYCLLNDGRLQKFLIMLGEGSNGKSVVLHLLTKMLGSENVSHVGLDQFHDRFALEPLLGKTANICGDLNEVDKVAEGVLKRLTGQDNLTVDRKNKALVPLLTSIKLVFACNSLPRFHDKSKGVWRRLIVMPFDVEIPEDQQDEQLAAKLEAELPGIFNFAIAGLVRLLKQGQFTKCSVCSAAKDRHQLDCDPLMQFVDECLELHPAGEIDKKDAYRDYKDWCDENGRRPTASGEFVRRLGKLPGVRSRRWTTGSRDYYFHGICKIGEAPDGWPEVEHIPSRYDSNGSAPQGRRSVQAVQNST